DCPLGADCRAGRCVCPQFQTPCHGVFVEASRCRHTNIHGGCSSDVCSSDPHCTAGACCSSGQVPCQGVCVDLLRDNNNCGTCGRSEERRVGKEWGRRGAKCK